MYHVISRGDRREDIYLDDVDRHDFIETLAEARQKTGWQVHSFCLMRNHYHLVVETPNANLVAGMAWLRGTCTIWASRKVPGQICTNGYSVRTVATPNPIGSLMNDERDHAFQRSDPAHGLTLLI